MYQFIVTTRGRDICVSDDATGWSSAGGNVGEIPTMSLAGNAANKWASRAVVALQLAAWTAVGIVLLEKGITTLRKSSHNSRNVSLEITTPIASSDWLSSQTLENSLEIDEQSENDTDSLSVVPIDDNVAKPSNTDTGPRSIFPWENSQTETRPKTTKLISDNDDEDSSASSPSDEWRRKIFAKSKDNSQDDDERNPVTIKVNLPPMDTSAEDRRWETRKRLRHARINSGGGIAAAVAMVAVGSVMLVLGPAVIFLRALDERRQERRFLKLSGEEDLPPSYEQATCELEPAPTYSSLNLDSIHVASTSNATGCSENSRTAIC